MSLSDNLSEHSPIDMCTYYVSKPYKQAGKPPMIGDILPIFPVPKNLTNRPENRQ